MIAEFRRNLKYWLIASVLLFSDWVAGWAAFKFHLSVPSVNAGYVRPLELFLILQILWTGLFYLNGRYRVDPTLSRLAEITSILKITFLACAAFILADELIAPFPLFPGPAVMTYWITLALLISSGRAAVRLAQKLALRRGYGRKATVVIGIGERARWVLSHLQNPHTGYNVVGLVQPNGGDPRARHHGYPLLGTVKELRQVIADHRPSEVIVALERPDHDKMLEIVTIANGSPISLKMVPDLYEAVSGLARTEQIHGLPLVQLNPAVPNWLHRVVKRSMDVLFAAIALFLFLPLWLAVAAAIRLDSRGAVFYRQERVGRNGKVFRIVKFRSMVADAESSTGPVWATEDDRRITAVGRVLRRFRLDEVPQFINVLVGDMSVVGPRPERPFFVQQLMEEYPFYYRRHRVRPGITGWAQVKHSYDTTIEDVRQKLKYDFFYLENMSVRLDVKIILVTISVMLSGRGQ